MARILIFSDDEQLSKQWQTLLATEHDVCIQENLGTTAIGDPAPLDRMAIVHSGVIAPDLGNLAPLTRQGLKLLIVGTDWTEDKQIYALVVGCCGYCEAGVAPELLAKAVGSILKGDIWIPRQLAPRLIGMLARLSPAVNETEKTYAGFEKNIDLLTHRERDVAKMLGEGLSNKLIAAMLNISERTVKAHLTSIFQKLEVPDRLQLALLIKNHI